MKESYIAYRIDVENKRNRALRKSWFIRKKCNKCKHKNTEICKIVETPENFFKCDNFEEVTNDI